MKKDKTIFLRLISKKLRQIHYINLLKVNAMIIKKPQIFDEAMKKGDIEEWLWVMNEELKCLEKNSTYELS